MRILFVCNEYPPAPHGGIGVFVKSLAEALIEKGHDAVVVGYDPSVQARVEQNIHGVVVIRLPKKQFRTIRIGRYGVSMDIPWSRYKLSMEVEKSIKRFKPDIVESFDWSGPLWKKPSAPLLVRMHGANTAHQVYENKKVSKLLYYFERKNLQFADMLCAVSMHIGELTLSSLNLEKKSFKCIYNFIDTEVFKPGISTVRDARKLLYVGRIHPRKGLYELFLLLRFLFELDTLLYIELAGPYSENYKNKLLKLLPKDCRKRIFFLGKIPHQELPGLYSSASLFIMPSRAEAFGLTAIEAMACGTPVFMTNRASAPEIIEDGVDGFLFDINEPEMSAQRIIEVLDDPQKLSAISSRALSKVQKKFSKQVVVSENLLAYNAVLHADF